MDNEIFNRNFDYLLEVNGFKVGYVEECCNVSTGYFSRKRKDGKLPGTKVLIELSKLLNVTIDALVTEDLTCVPEKMNLLCKFIDKIIDDIDNGKVEVKLFDDVSGTYMLDYIGIGNKNALMVYYPSHIDVMMDQKLIPLKSLDEYPKVRAHMDRLWSKIKIVDMETRIHLGDKVIELLKEFMNA